MLETLTRLNCAMPAFLKASSKLESFFLCLPTPFVTKAFVGVKPPLLIKSAFKLYLRGEFVKRG